MAFKKKKTISCIFTFLFARFSDLSPPGKLQCKNNSWQMFYNRESYMFDNEIHEADTLSFQP